MHRHVDFVNTLAGIFSKNPSHPSDAYSTSLLVSG